MSVQEDLITLLLGKLIVTYWVRKFLAGSRGYTALSTKNFMFWDMMCRP
jgi:hypothetical protein